MTLVARYEFGGNACYGILEGETLHRIEGNAFDGLLRTGQTDLLADVQLLSPVDALRVFGVGMNYVSHIAETKGATPTRPMLFMKPSSAVIGPNAPVVLPREARVTHYEAELAVVIGKRCRRLSEDDVHGAIFGLSCANDISERVIQKEEMDQGCLLIGKGFDTFCPLGPVIATELDPSDLKLEARLNGRTVQSVRTSDLLFSATDLVRYLSHAITLEPGDVIITGTPSGVGEIAPGDQMEIELEGVGVLANPVVAET